jgi:probable rRNA maturation factor
VITIEDNPDGLKPAALTRFVEAAARSVGLRGEVHVLITNSSRIRELNRQYRGKDIATDVLSFPAANFDHSAKRNPRDVAQIAGDIAISADIAAGCAAALGHAVSTEVKILILHGVLHLAGYNHESDNGEMAALEQRLRRTLRLPSALIERSTFTTGKRARS